VVLLNGYRFLPTACGPEQGFLQQEKKMAFAQAIFEECWPDG